MLTWAAQLHVSKRLIMKNLITLMFRLGAMVTSYNVLLSMEIHYKPFLKFPPCSCHKRYSKFSENNVDSSIPAVQASLGSKTKGKGV